MNRPFSNSCFSSNNQAHSNRKQLQPPCLETQIQYPLLLTIQSICVSFPERHDIDWPATIFRKFCCLRDILRLQFSARYQRRWIYSRLSLPRYILLLIEQYKLRVIIKEIIIKFKQLMQIGLEHCIFTAIDFMLGARNSG
ncbi:hypothetical protein D3C78_870400 [compost metagenome]